MAHRCIRLVALMLLVSCFLISETRAQERISLANTPAGQAFRAKQYARALAEFTKLAQANPNNALILRYLGITLDRLGKYGEAIKVFQQALAIAPNDVALHFHAGVSYYNAGSATEASVHLQKAMDGAPDSKYAGHAQRYLQALRQPRTRVAPPDEAKRLALYLQLSYQDDDNVPSAPRDPTLFAGARSGDRVGGYLSLDYYLVRKSPWLAALGVSAYKTRYSDRQFDPFGVFQYAGSLLLQRNGAFGNVPHSVSARLEHREADRDEGGSYSRSSVLALAWKLGLSANTSSKVHYRFGRDDFADEGFDPAFSSRDADNHALGLTHAWFFAQGSGKLAVGVEYQDNRADGVNFEMQGTGVSLDLSFLLPWQLKAEIGVKYTDEDYDDFAGPVPRETNRRNASAAITRWFGRHFFTKVEYSVVDEDSSYDSLAYVRHAWGVNVNYVY